MKIKLIDWATVPVGAMTSCGELRGELLGNAFVELVNRHGYVVTNNVETVGLRLAPSDQQPWLLYKGGKTVIPEWAECEYAITENSDYGQCSYLDVVKILPEFFEENYQQYEIAKYKLTGIKDGWTDNPNGVSK